MQNVASDVALFIDLENIAISLWKREGQQPNPSRLVAHARKYGLIALARVYADFSMDMYANWEHSFRNANIEPFHCPVKVKAEYSQSTVDMNMVIDMYETAQDRPGIGTFIVMAGDGDYVRVVARLRHRFGKRVVIAGIPGSVSRDLIEAAGEEDPIQTAEVTDIDEAATIRVFLRYEDSRHEGVMPTFRGAAEYLKHPSNQLDAGLVESTMNRLVERGILLQTFEETQDGREIRTTRLDRSNPVVQEMMGE